MGPGSQNDTDNVREGQGEARDCEGRRIKTRRAQDGGRDPNREEEKSYDVCGPNENVEVARQQEL